MKLYNFIIELIVYIKLKYQIVALIDAMALMIACNILTFFVRTELKVIVIERKFFVGSELIKL